MLLRPCLAVPFSLAPPPFNRNLPNQKKCIRRLLDAGSSTVKVHCQKYDAAQDLQLYMNSHGAHVHMGLHCTIKGNYCAMIEDPLSYDWKTRAGMQRPLTSPRGVRSRNSQNCTCAQTCATQRTVTEQIGTCASGGENHQKYQAALCSQLPQLPVAHTLQVGAAVSYFPN